MLITLMRWQLVREVYHRMAVLHSLLYSTSDHVLEGRGRRLTLIEAADTAGMWLIQARHLPNM